MPRHSLRDPVGSGHGTQGLIVQQKKTGLWFHFCVQWALSPKNTVSTQNVPFIMLPVSCTISISLLELPGPQDTPLAAYSEALDTPLQYPDAFFNDIGRFQGKMVRLGYHSSQNYACFRQTWTWFSSFLTYIWEILADIPHGAMAMPQPCWTQTWNHSFRGKITVFEGFLDFQKNDVLKALRRPTSWFLNFVMHKHHYSSLLDRWSLGN